MRTLLILCVLAASSTLAAQPSYVVSADVIAGGYTDLSGSTPVSLARGAVTPVISPPGFSFHYFGELCNSFQIASSGYIILGGGGTTAASAPLPSHDGGRIIAPLWHDYDPAAALGSPISPSLPPPPEISWVYANDILAVQWRNLPRHSGTSINSSGVRMKVLLDTARREIEFHYGATPSGTTGAVARVNYTASIASLVGIASQEVIAAADGSNILNDGQVWAYPAGRRILFEPQFPPPNTAPEISVTWDSGAGPTPIADNGSINVAYLAQVAALSFVVTVSDADLDVCNVSAAITNVGTTGIVLSEWEFTSGQTPIGLNPTSGSFNQLTGMSYQFTLTADDGAAITIFSFTVNQAPDGPGLLVEESSVVINSGDPAVGTSRDFGSQFIDEGPTAALTIEITNTGGSDLSLAGFATSGDASAFVIDTTGMAASVSSGASTTFSVAFDPTTVGPKLAVISFTHNAPSPSPFEVEVVGLATEKLPVLVVREAGPTGPVVSNGGTVNFGTLDLSQGQSITRTFHIQNTGNADLTLAALASGAAEFDTQSSAIPGNYLPTETLTFTITYQPGGAGSHVATISLDHNDPLTASPFTFDVTGTAVAGTPAKNSGGASSSGSGGCAPAGGTRLIALPMLALFALRRRRA